MATVKNDSAAKTAVKAAKTAAVAGSWHGHGRTCPQSAASVKPDTAGPSGASADHEPFQMDSA